MSKRARPETSIPNYPKGDRMVWTTISKRTIVLFAISLLGSTLAIASTRGTDSKSLSQLPAFAQETLPRSQAEFLSKASLVRTPQNAPTYVDESLSPQLPAVTPNSSMLATDTFLAPPTIKVLPYIPPFIRGARGGAECVALFNENWYNIKPIQTQSPLC